MMKKTNTIILLTVLGLLTIGCAKDDSSSQQEGMRLSAEGFHTGDKAAVSGNALYWVSGETVRINGVDYTVQVDGDGSAYVSDVVRSATYRALYPNTLDADASLEDDAVTVDIPDTYTYAVSGGRQVLDVPMAAYGTSGERLEFKHLTAAINVEIENSFGIDVTVDKIVVCSDSYQLSGSTTIDLSDAGMGVVSNNDDVADDDKKVTVLFNGGTALDVEVGAVATVQVPVLPVGAGNHFTVEVTVHNSDDAEMTYTFERTQETGGALPRKYMGYARAKFGGVFSVSEDKQIYFSLGNLQWSYNSGATHAVNGGGTALGTWRFAQHQYDYIGNDNSSIASNYNGWIDLFGYGTSGRDGKNPYAATTDYTSNYWSNSLTGTSNVYDWGMYNAISNGGNTANQWRTTTKDEWSYLINRSGKWSLATVNSVAGLILLPDDWTLPTGCSYTAGTGGASYTTAQWKKMEVAGAIFLPKSGCRAKAAMGTNVKSMEGVGSYGYYWSATFYGGGNNLAYALTFSSSTPSVGYLGNNGYKGYSVRLVKDVE